MLIDWFTVAAQALNFLVLVWLLKRFLYKPVLDAVDARERRIAAERAEADAKKAEAGAERAEFARRNAEFDRQRADLLAQAKNAAEAERQRMIEAARREADGLRARQREQLDGEYRKLRSEAAARTQAEVFAVARKVLADLAGVSLEERAADMFVRRLQGLDEAEKAKLAPLRALPSVPARVRSAFDLPAPLRAGIENALGEALSMRTQVRYEVAPELVGGIELTLQGWTLSWNVRDYLASLEMEAGAAIAGHDGGCPVSGG